LGDNVPEKDTFILKELEMRKAEREKFTVDAIIYDQHKRPYVHTRRQMYQLYWPNKDNEEALRQFLEKYPSEDDEVYRSHGTAMKARSKAKRDALIEAGVVDPPIPKERPDYLSLRVMGTPSKKMQEYLEATKPHRRKK
jgi:hypothetical protein